LKKLKLDDSPQAEFRGLGIVSPEKDYRLCFLINQKTGWELEKTATLHIFDPAGQTRKEVPAFVHTNPENEYRTFLVKNRQESFFVVPEMKQADYIILQPFEQADTMNLIKKLISDITAVQSCFAISAQNLKHIDAE